MERWWLDRTEDPQLICTTLAQATELVKLGADPKTADMSWTKSVWTSATIYGEEGYCLFCYPDAQTSEDHEPTPCWSTNAMIDLLPEHINQGEDVCHLYIYRDFYQHWTIMYECKGSGKGYAVNVQPTLRDAVFHMLKWYLTYKRDEQNRRDNNPANQGFRED